MSITNTKLYLIVRNALSSAEREYMLVTKSSKTIPNVVKLKIKKNIWRHLCLTILHKNASEMFEMSRAAREIASCLILKWHDKENLKQLSSPIVPVSTCTIM